jgi:hypothetical protein
VAQVGRRRLPGQEHDRASRLDDGAIDVGERRKPLFVRG